MRVTMLRDREILRLRPEHGGVTWLLEREAHGLVWEKYLHWDRRRIEAAANLPAFIAYTIEFLQSRIDHAVDLERLA